METYNSLHSLLSEYNQTHLLQFWNELSESEQLDLAKSIKALDLSEVTNYFKVATETKIEKLDDRIAPIDDEQYNSWNGTSGPQLQEYWERGLQEIGDGHVGVLLMAGGQGTRLGVTYPKGMYDVGLPSHKTLFQVQAERIIKLQSLAYELTNKNGVIVWYIMTSGPTITQTKEYFEANSYFGLDPKNVVMFEQGLLPCFDFEGRIILDSKNKIALSPDGNGGIYKALHSNQIIAHMKKNNVKYLHTHSVDNILIKVADPTFIGYCVLNKSDCAAKVVEKTQPNEAVGIICQIDEKIQVVEYSEITKETSELKSKDGSLQFKAGNICNHFFSREFLEGSYNLKLHSAKKKIPFVNDNGVREVPKIPNGIKIEKFVFDVFEFSKKFLVWEVRREDEFSALKNASGADSPQTAREDLFKLHKRYLKEIGCEVDGDVCEIAPQLSYNGEGLTKFAGQVLKSPVLLN